MFMNNAQADPTNLDSTKLENRLSSFVVLPGLPGFNRSAKFDILNEGLIVSRRQGESKNKDPLKDL